MTVLGGARRLAAGFGAGAAGAGVFWGAYLNVIGIAAARGLRGERAESLCEHALMRFRVLVPAHDEEANIGATLASLATLDYPPDLVEVHVVADNCRDTTAAVARARGVDVHERVDADHPGKGPALAWLIDRLPPGDPDDGVVVIDADTVVCAGLLHSFAKGFTGDGAAIQGNYQVKDASQGGEIGFRAAALAVRHVVRPAGRTALGGSASLYGNGMAFRESIARHYRWSDSLTEDLEMGLRLLLDGHTVGFAPDAVVEAEMPATLEAATSQNERWEAGRLSVARSYGPSLFRAARRRDHGRRWAYLDAAIDISLPPLTTAVAGTAAAGGAVLALGRGRGRRVGVSAAGVGVVLQVAHVFHSLGIAGAPPAVRRSLLRAPVHVVWKSRLLARVARRRPSSWVRTSRGSQAVAA